MKTFSIVNDDISDGYHTFGELYEHRHMLMLSLMAAHWRLAWCSKKHDDGSHFDGWFVAGIDLPTGTITYHLPDRLWVHAVHTCAEIRDQAPKWDGHTASDVVKRLERFVCGLETK
jgi:hypothetical protein